MSKILKIDEVVFVNPVSGKVLYTGRQHAMSHGLDPDKCEVTVDGAGVLRVEQEGVDRVLKSPLQHWRRATEKLRPDDFVHVSPLRNITPGREFLEVIGFDPAKCEISVNADALRVSQEGLIPWVISPEFWKRAQK